VHVALVVERLAARGGGVERVAHRIARELSARGDRVSVIAREAEASDLPAGIEFVRVPAPRAWQPLRVALFSRAAQRAARRLRPDVVYSLARAAGAQLYRAGAGCHPEYLDALHGGPGRALRRASPRHRALERLERQLLRDSRVRVQFTSAWVRDQFERRYGFARERGFVLPPAVDAEAFAAGERQAAAGPLWRARAGRELVWLFAGSGFRRKGLDLALAALARGPARAELWVAGRDEPGPWRRLAARLGLAQRVRFLGPVDDLAACYAVSDALLLPTRYDAFANVCLEAAAAGRPVVTSSRNGAAELLREIGVATPEPEDVAAFAAALDRLEDPREREREGAACRALALRQRWDRQIAALREELERAAASESALSRRSRS